MKSVPELAAQPLEDLVLHLQRRAHLAQASAGVVVADYCAGRRRTLHDRMTGAQWHGVYVAINRGRMRAALDSVCQLSSQRALPGLGTCQLRLGLRGNAAHPCVVVVCAPSHEQARRERQELGGVLFRQRCHRLHGGVAGTAGTQSLLERCER